MDPKRARDLYQKYAAAVAYVAVETPSGDHRIGSAFHLGENIWVTARHVVDGNKILEIGTTTNSIEDYSEKLEKNNGVLDGDWFSASGGYKVVGQPMLHPEQGVDVAVLRLEGPYTRGWIGHEPELWGERSRQPIPIV